MADLKSNIRNILNTGPVRYTQNFVCNRNNQATFCLLYNAYKVRWLSVPAIIPSAVITFIGLSISGKRLQKMLTELKAQYLEDNGQGKKASLLRWFTRDPFYLKSGFNLFKIGKTSDTLGENLLRAYADHKQFMCDDWSKLVNKMQSSIPHYDKEGIKKTIETASVILEQGVKALLQIQGPLASTLLNKVPVIRDIQAIIFGVLLGDALVSSK